TNNRMELFAVISGLGALKMSCEVDVYSDSTYVVDAINQHWLEGWQKNNWKQSAGEPVANQDLWKLLIIILRKHVVHFHKVKGHSDNELNNRCDELARGAISRYVKANADLFPEQQAER
ncbi:MAG: ribonuclease HI, partial [Clostridia bacterium]|nr:ribonuclease HI [Clostridia bacterium]